MISPEHIEAIRQATDIVDLVSGYLSLKPSGRNFIALCPFHREKTPSFNVSPERQIYKCFGCQVGGDVFSFLMAMESVTFLEAARTLADRAGIRLETTPGSHREHLDRERLAEATAFAANLYERVLHQEKSGEPGRRYLERRGLRAAVARAWKLGYAPDDRDFLHTRARAAGFSPEELERAGLLYPPRDGLPGGDRFTERIMFPIFNTRDQVAGFGGRAIREEQKAKYINSREGPLFQKSRILFGLDKVNRARRRRPELRKARIYVAEGYLDVIALHAAGLETAVAPLGTALTADHVRLLRPADSPVVLVFDGDRAGTDATRRAIAELVSQDLEVEVTRPTAGRDPFSIFQEEGPEALRGMVARPLSAYEFVLEHALGTRGESVEGRAAAAADVAEILGRTPNAVKEEGYIRRAAFDLRTSAAALRKVWFDRKAGRAGPEAAPAGSEGPRHDRNEKAELELALALVGKPELVQRAVREVPLRCLGDARVRSLVGVFYDLCEEGRRLEIGPVLDRLRQDPDGAAVELATHLVTEADARLAMREEGRIDRDRDPFEDLYQGFLAHLERAAARRRRRRLVEHMLDAVAKADSQAVADNLAAIAELDRTVHGTGIRSGAPGGAIAGVEREGVREGDPEERGKEPAP